MDPFVNMVETVDLSSRQLFLMHKIYRIIKDIAATPAAAAKSLQSCPTLCEPIDGSPLDSSVPGILQARTLEWVAISFSTMEHYSAIEKNEIMPSAATWMDLERSFYVK